jgi:hypothetical protein
MLAHQGCQAEEWRADAKQKSWNWKILAGIDASTNRPRPLTDPGSPGSWSATGRRRVERPESHGGPHEQGARQVEQRGCGVDSTP